MKLHTPLFVLFMLCFSLPLLAQPGNTGMRFSHYGGTMSTYENPAFGANSHTKWEVQLFNVNNILENDAIRFKWKTFLDDGELGDLVQKEGDQFSFRNVLEVQGPAVFFSYKKKFAFGINTRTRFFFQMRETNLDFANALLTDDNFDLGKYGAITEDYMNLNMNLLTDIGITGSAQVFKSHKHSLYAGASLRFYRGAAAIDFTAKNVDIDPDKIISNDTVVEFSADMQFNGSVPTDYDIINGEQGVQVGDVFRNSWNKSAGSGIGGDIGAVYQGKLLNRSVRAAVSMTDIGQINYNKGRQYSGSFVANNVSIPADSFDNFPNGYDSIKQWAADYGVHVDTGNNAFTQQLPTRMNLYAELQILKGLHVGLAHSSNMSTATTKSSSYSSYSALIPRWQSKALEVWAPVSYNYFSKNLKAGFGARLAFLYFGSDDLLSLASGEAKGVNFYFGMRVSGNYSKNKVKKAEK